MSHSLSRWHRWHWLARHQRWCRSQDRQG